MQKFIARTLILGLSINTAFSMEPTRGEAPIPSEGVADTKAKQVNVIFPINNIGISKGEMTDSQTSLLIKVPTNFKSLSDVEKAPSVMEFIPATEEMGNRTKLLTLFLDAGNRTQAEQMTDDFKKKFKEGVVNSQVLAETKKNFGHYNFSELAMSYSTGVGKEVILIRAYSGPADLCCVNYTAVVKDGSTPSETLAQSRAFLDQITKLLDKSNSAISAERMLLPK